MPTTPKQLNGGCTATHGPYLCELAADHDGPHRVQYYKHADVIWRDE